MGAGPPILGPGYNLPGAEYFALVPNRSIALGPRLNIGNQTAPVVSVPAGTSTTAANSGTLDANFVYGHALWIVRAYALYVPADPSSELVITGARMGVGQPPAVVFLDIGTPVSIFSSPPFAQIAIFERDLLITSQDLPTFPQNTPLSLIVQLGVHNNDATNAHSFQLGFTVNLHLVQGFVQ